MRLTDRQTDGQTERRQQDRALCIRSRTVGLKPVTLWYSYMKCSMPIPYFTFIQ